MQIKNVTLSATTETEITIEQGYPYVWFKNLGDNTVYVSASPDILDNGSVKTEGVSTITSGECTSVTTKSDKVYAYALGATIVEVHAQGNPESSFKIKAKGGESSVTVEPILIKQNGEYTAPEGKAYSPVNVQTPVYNITPLTLTHNHQGADAGLYGGYSPVEVQIEMDTLNAPANGVYQIDENTQDGWDTVLVDVYEKYNELFFSSGNNYSPQVLTDDITDTDYDELWVIGYYLYGDGTGNHISLWSCRYPTDALFPSMLGTYIFGGGSHNHMWVAPTDDNYFATAVAEYDYPYMYIGVKNKDKEQDLLWKNTESTTPSTIILSESIFDYDEVCFYFYKDVGTSNVASWYLTSEISVGDIIQGYDDNNVSKYTIASNTTLTVLSEGSNGYKLRAVYGIKDNSIQKTTLFTNPNSSDVPATITLSDAYINYDEFVLVGHYTSDGTKCSNSYPVKVFGKRELDTIHANDRVGLFTTQADCWLAFTSTTTLVPDSTSPAVIIDKIIGIKRPVISTAHELIDVEPLSVTTNGTYTAPTGTAYSPVVVDVVEQPWQPLQDGYSNFWFELTDDTLSPWLNFSAKNNDAVIDWGDGSGEVALDTLTPTHTYSKAGKYVVKVKGVRGIIRIFNAPYNGYTKTLNYVELNNEVTTLGNYAFAFANRLYEIKTTSALVNLNIQAFSYCTALKKLDFSIGITDIPNNICYTGLGLEELVIPNTVTTIGQVCFYSCINLSKVTIPASVTSIGQQAFRSCASLSEIHVLSNAPPTLGENVFQNVASDYIIYAPVGYGDTYKAAAGWSAYADHILEEGQTVTRAMQRKFEANALKNDDESSDKR